MLIPCFSLNQEVDSTKFQITAIDSKIHKTLLIPARKNNDIGQVWNKLGIKLHMFASQ